jgi:hypothetical protein
MMAQESTTQTAITLDDLYTLDQLVEAYPRVLTLTALRWQLRYRDQNGLAPAVLKIRKKILISKSRYEQWLATQAGGKA